MVTTYERDDKLFHCPALTTIKLISGKWKTRILWLLRERSHSFNELRRVLPGVSAKVLAEQIAQLEDGGLVYKRKVERDGQTYSDIGYTSYGLSLVPVLDGLGEWGLVHQRGESQR
jgi:DNA-binding HxlR family transcriptional regulator